MSSKPIPLFTTPQEVNSWMDTYNQQFKTRHHILYKLSIVAVLYSLMALFFPKFLWESDFLIYASPIVLVLGATIKMHTQETTHSYIHIWWEAFTLILGISFILDFIGYFTNIFTLVTTISIADSYKTSPRLLILGFFLIGHGLIGLKYLKLNSRYKEKTKLFKEYIKENKPFAAVMAKGKVFFEGTYYDYRPELNVVASAPAKPVFNAEEYKRKRLEEIESKDTDLNFNDKLSDQADNVQKALNEAENFVQNNKDAKKAALEEKRKEILKNL